MEASPAVSPALTTSTTVFGSGVTSVVVAGVVSLPIAAATSARIAAGSTMLTDWPSIMS